MWSLKVFDHQPVSSSLCESVWPITSFFMTFHELLDLSSPQVFSKWLHKSSFQKGSKKGKNIQVVHGSHVQPTRLRAMPLAPCHITTYEPWRKNCHISTETFTIQIPCIYVILSWFLVASHTQLWLNRYVTPAKLWARFKLSLCVQGSSQSKAIGAKTGTQQKKQRNLFVTGAKGGVWFSGAKELVYNRSKGFSLCLLCLLYEKQEQTARSAWSLPEQWISIQTTQKSVFCDHHH